jgi:hypothetical protein
MRRSTSLVLTIVALCGSMIALSPSVAAQDPTADSPCVGSWVWRVVPPGQPEFIAYSMFMADGGFITERSPVTAGPADAPENVTFPGGGYGAWEPTETGACAATFVGLDTDSLGNLLTTVEIRFVLEVAPDGQTMSTVGRDYATITAPDGSVVFEGFGGTITGTRIVVKLPPSPSPSPSASASAAP